MADVAGLLVDWARLTNRQANLPGDTYQAMAEARVPVDASQMVKEHMLRAAIGKWLRWQSGRGWRLVSDVHVGKPRSTLDTRTGKTMPASVSYEMTGVFEYRGAGSVN